jgi:hypothetical protein
MGNSCKIHLQNCSTNETKLCRNVHYGRTRRNLEENTNIHVCGPIDTKVTTLGKDLVRIIATKFGLILFSGSQEEIQNVVCSSFFYVLYSVVVRWCWCFYTYFQFLGAIKSLPDSVGVCPLLKAVW